MMLELLSQCLIFLSNCLRLQRLFSMGTSSLLFFQHFFHLPQWRTYFQPQRFTVQRGLQLRCFGRTSGVQQDFLVLFLLTILSLGTSLFQEFLTFLAYHIHRLLCGFRKILYILLFIPYADVYIRRAVLEHWRHLRSYTALVDQ